MIQEYMPYIWFLVVVTMALLEVGTSQLVSIWFVISGIVAFFMSITGCRISVQAIAFLIVAIVLLLFTRPFVHRWISFEPEDTNLGRYIGKEAVVISEVNNSIGAGQVNVEGKIWSAISLNGENLCINDRVTVRGIKGVKLLVEKD